MADVWLFVELLEIKNGDEMNTENKVYKIVSGDGRVFLVQAKNANTALRHFASRFFSVERAKAIEVADLMGSGIKVEVAPSNGRGRPVKSKVNGLDIV